MARKKKATLKYAWFEYTPEALASGVLTEKEIRAEYNRLRSIANKRVERLGRAGYKKSQAYLKNVNAYKSASNYNLHQLQYKLYQVSKFVAAKASTVSGMREIEKTALEKLHEKELQQVKDIWAFGDFMDWARAKYKGMDFDSERAAEVYNEAKRRDIDVGEIKKDYEMYKSHYKEFERLPVYRLEERKTSEWYKKIFGGEVNPKTGKEYKKAGKKKKKG